MLFIVGFIYGIILQKDFITGYVYTGLKLVFVHFFLSGLILSSACKFIAEKYMRKEEKKAVHKTLNSIEPMYAFDIHCNSFFPFFVITYALQVRLMIQSYDFSF